MPQLSERARGLLCRLTAQERKNFSKLKSSILDGLRLSAAEYKRLFSESKRREKESWDQFAVRLENYFDYYVESSKASTFKELKQLVVADRLKQCLSPEARAHVVCNEEDAFLSPSAVAKLAERFEESERSRSAQRKASVEEGQKKPKTLADGPTDARWKKRCFECKSTDHFARDCPQRGFVAKQGTKSAARPENRPVVARVMGPAFESTVGTTDRVGQDTQPKQHGLATVTLKSSGQPFDAVVDSGAEVSVIRKSVLPKYDPTGSQIKLTGAFGQQVIAELAYVPLTASEGSPYVGSEAGQAAVLCALTDKLLEGTDALITPNDYAQLLEERAFPNGVPDERPTAKETGAAAEEAGETCEEQPATTCVLITEGSSEAPEPVKSKREEFREAQVADPALRGAWAQAKAGSHGMLVQDELLYHKESVAGRACKQLVLPSHRHTEVLKMAHDSPWAGHLGERKTLQRVKSSFYWPRVSQDVKEYCRSCHECQVKSPARQKDRVPITPLARPSAPFQTVNMDCIGPLDPPSARGHRYALCVVDLHTRWPEVVCLRSLTAKATCDALLQIFSRHGVPETICSDQGTNFTSRLTQETLQRLGATPRFSTPDHPQSNGLVERWNATFKRMLFHIVSEHGREWDRMIPFLLWAYREVPHATTGRSPFELMYGPVPHGPLSILEKAWSGDWVVPESLGIPAAEYLSRLRNSLKEASEQAARQSEATQREYVGRYNLRATDKQFPSTMAREGRRRQANGKVEGTGHCYRETATVQIHDRARGWNAQSCSR